ncbi:PepSY-associated TM helix domain-containing protein [Fulvimonas sp. R45]|uniref:PepSY-associated TM helix domain-containing protein n=1 Tax=Fulvimonas sp. R45 TaxID=3045937 RepID=UPI00265D721D|nr:PepSY-associated TM helix domain-containing protein [Fulvimonas sp. R45]MDO1528074.1 PepSY-associated TM helix domain-containing protein [Fulvimonas sp. R45]
MKPKPATLRVFTSLHSWVGLLAGLALFVAFYAGAITVFQQPVQQWATPHAAATGSIDDMQRLLDAVLARHPDAGGNLGMTFPGYMGAGPSAYWPDRHGTWQFATLDNPDGSPQRPGADLPVLVNELHFSLGLPETFGMYLMGVVSLLYGIALVSGLVIHLPRLARDLFALRPGRNLKRFWQDAHNAIGVLSLPFHAVFAVTGAMLCLSVVLMMALGPLGWQGKLLAASGPAMDTAPAVRQAGVARPMLPVAAWVAHARAVARDQGLDGFTPQYLKLAHGGDAHATVEITGDAPRTLAAGTLALDATSGALLASQLPGHRDANHATLAWAYALHFGNYGNAVVQWLYFLLGLGGAFLFYSGNLLWIESRRRRRQAEQGRSSQVMARATVGVCIGVCVAISAAAVAAQLLPRLGWDVATGERWACFAGWALCLLWACARAPARGACELLWLAAVLTALAPLAHGFATGGWFWRNAAAGQLAPAAVDLGALALALGFATLARATARRARDGEPNSVWALARPA